MSGHRVSFEISRFAGLRPDGGWVVVDGGTVVLSSPLSEGRLHSTSEANSHLQNTGFSPWCKKKISGRACRPCEQSQGIWKALWFRDRLLSMRKEELTATSADAPPEVRPDRAPASQPVISSAPWACGPPKVMKSPTLSPQRRRGSRAGFPLSRE